MSYVICHEKNYLYTYMPGNYFICASWVILRSDFPVTFSYKISPKSSNRVMKLEIMFLFNRNATEKIGRSNVV